MSRPGLLSSLVCVVASLQPARSGTQLYRQAGAGLSLLTVVERRGASNCGTECENHEEEQRERRVELSADVLRLQVSFKLWDIGGQAKYRSEWPRYTKGCNVIAFMIDTTVSCFVCAVRARIQFAPCRTKKSSRLLARCNDPR